MGNCIMYHCFMFIKCILFIFIFRFYFLVFIEPHAQCTSTCTLYTVLLMCRLRRFYVLLIFRKIIGKGQRNKKIENAFEKLFTSNHSTQSTIKKNFCCGIVIIYPVSYISCHFFIYRDRIDLKFYHFSVSLSSLHFCVFRNYFVQVIRCGFYGITRTMV